MSDLGKEDFERIDRLFSAALEHPEERRDRFLQASDEPEAVVARVRRLLAAEGRVEDRFGESAAIVAGEVFDGVSEPQRILVGHPQHVVRETLGGRATDSGQPTEFGQQTVHRFAVGGHVLRFARV